LRCIRREGTPERVHNIELLIDGEVQEEICRRFNLLEGLDPSDPFFKHRRQIVLQSFLGYDYVVCPEGIGESTDGGLVLNNIVTTDTAGLKRERGRSFIDEHRGPITNWKEFEAYPWPEPDAFQTHSLAWFQENLPDNMCMIGGLVGSFFEGLSFLMGYETLCISLYDQRDLVAAISQRLTEIFTKAVERILEFDRVKLVWGSDDMGTKRAH
jgi:uroporphyrinogen decarboxylase